MKWPDHMSEGFEFLDRAQNWQETYHSHLENYSIFYHNFCHGKNTEDKMAFRDMVVKFFGMVCCIIWVGWINRGSCDWIVEIVDVVVLCNAIIPIAL